MPAILVTAFLPFGGMEHNASLELLNRLPKDDTISILILPVSYEGAFETLQKRIANTKPAYLFLCGQAASSTKISLEVRAQNQMNSEKPDHDGMIYQNTTIQETGAKYLYSTMPVVSFLGSVLEEGIPIQLSKDAGMYVCNALYYQTLWHYPDIPTLFIHLPLYFQQEKNHPGAMDLEQMVLACNKLFHYFDD